MLDEREMSMVIGRDEFEQARQMREDIQDFEQAQEAENTYGGYVPLDESEMDGFHIICDNEED